MSCTTDRRQFGFTFVELATTIALIALAVLFGGQSVWDQLQAQRVVSAVDQGRQMALIIENIRPMLRELPSGTFAGNYRKNLDAFMQDMNEVIVLKNGFLSSINPDEQLLGESASDIYQVILSDKAAFIKISLDDVYVDYDIYSAARGAANEAVWTVSGRQSSVIDSAYQYINLFNQF